MLVAFLKTDVVKSPLSRRRSAIRNGNIKASFMAAHCVDTGHEFNLAEAKILSHASSWTARLFKEAWLSIENSIIAAGLLRFESGN